MSSKKLDAAIDALVDVLAELPEHELEGWQRGNRLGLRILCELCRRYPNPGAGDGTGSPQVGLSALPARPGLRARTCSLTRSSFTCNFARYAAAAALVGKNLLARRRVWPFRTYHSNELSALVCRRRGLFRASDKSGLLELRPSSLVKHGPEGLHLLLDHLCRGFTANERIGMAEAVP